MEIQKITNCKYLSEFIDILPSGYIINKGITGCGGTTLELESKRDSIILCPTRNLVTSKASLGYFGVDGTITKKEITNYLITHKGYKKIVATYDALEKLMETIPDYQNYFLLIDEYHLLFNDYSFRDKAILYILNNFKQFKQFAFLTATPLKEEFILDELKDLPQITYEWDNAIPVRINIRDTAFTQKELLYLINVYKDRNLHIFLNSVATIRNIVNKLDIDDYRVVCSETSKTKISHFAKVTDPICKINFYTSCSFEGVDLYDPNGYSIILSDTNIALTVLDIATKVRQICGRIRDSKYKDEVTIILNTNKHRYAGTTEKEFYNHVAESERLGKIKESAINRFSPDELLAEMKTYNKESYSNIYLNKYDNKIFYDENLKKLDIYNYKLISEIYNNTISVISEINNNKYLKVESVKKTLPPKGLSFIIDKLKELNKSEYTYDELTEIFTPIFKEHKLNWNSNSSIRLYFPECKKIRKTIKDRKLTYYKFDI